MQYSAELHMLSSILTQILVGWLVYSASLKHVSSDVSIRVGIDRTTLVITGSSTTLCEQFLLVESSGDA